MNEDKAAIPGEPGPNLDKAPDQSTEEALAEYQAPDVKVDADLTAEESQRLSGGTLPPGTTIEYESEEKLSEDMEKNPEKYGRSPLQEVLQDGMIGSPPISTWMREQIAATVREELAKTASTDAPEEPAVRINAKQNAKGEWSFDATARGDTPQQANELLFDAIIQAVNKAHTLGWKVAGDPVEK